MLKVWTLGKRISISDVLPSGSPVKKQQWNWMEVVETDSYEDLWKTK